MDQTLYLVALKAEDFLGGETLGVCATLEEANRLKALLEPQEVEIRPLRVITSALLDKWEEKKREANRLAHEAWLEKVRREKENVPLPPIACNRGCFFRGLPENRCRSSKRIKFRCLTR